MPTKTPKYDAIMEEFCARIQDPVTFSGSTFYVVPGKILTTQAKIEKYITEAMFILINQVWLQCAQRPKPLETFAEIFPELLFNTPEVSLHSTEAYYEISAGNGNLNYMYLLSGRANAYLGSVKPSYLYQSAISGQPQLRGEATYPIIIETGKKIYVFPISTFGNKKAYFTYIIQPLMPATGLYITQNNASSIDSPFYDQWNSKIAEIAVQQFLTKQGVNR